MLLSGKISIFLWKLGLGFGYSVEVLLNLPVEVLIFFVEFPFLFFFVFGFFPFALESLALILYLLSKGSWFLSSIIGEPKVFKTGKPDLSNNNVKLGSCTGFPFLSNIIGLLLLSLIGFPSFPINGFNP